MSTASATSAEVEVLASAAPPVKKKPVVLIVIVSLSLIAALGGGAFFMLRKSAAPAEHAASAQGEGGKLAAPASYLPLQPAFVVNLADEEAARYLQVEIEAMSRDAKALDEVKNHLPRIRNALLMLLSQKRAHEIATREAKEALQKQVLDEIQKILSAETGKPVVDAVYFTSFVIQ